MMHAGDAHVATEDLDNLSQGFFGMHIKVPGKTASDEHWPVVRKHENKKQS